MSLVHQQSILLLALILIFLATVEIGFRLGQRMNVATDELRHEQLASARDAIGLLVSLLLGFTLAMAFSRFEQRKQMIVDEANSIGTTSMRAQMLPEPTRGKMVGLLRAYVDARIRFSEAPLDSQDFNLAVAKAKKLQNDIWALSVDVARTNPNAITSLFVQSLNDSIDMSEKRLSILENRVPNPIWIMPTLISLLTCLTVGMTVRRRFWFVMAITPLMISVVMALIADLNSPRSGFLQTGRQSIQRLQQDMRGDNHGLRVPFCSLGILRCA